MTALYMPSVRISISGLFSKPQLQELPIQVPAQRKLISFGGRTFTAIFDRESAREHQGAVNVSILELPGCNSWGRSESEALAAIHEAVELYLED